MTIYNFAAGPATLPAAVLQVAQRDLTALPGAGISLLEMSHRSKPVIDMIDTAGTICAAADQLTQRGAARVIAATTHGVFSGSALERLTASSIEKVIVTNTLPLPDDADPDLVEVLSIAPLVARAIDAVFEDTSVSEIFGGNNLA